MSAPTRRPMLVSALAAAGFLGLFQGFFLFFRNQAFGSPELGLGLMRLGMILAFVTVLVLLPAVLVLRRRHADWSTDRLRATWAACLGLCAALAGWTLADLVATMLRAPRVHRWWIALAVALLAGRTAAFLQPPPRWLKVWAVVSVVLFLLCFTPGPRGRNEPGAETAPEPAPVRAGAEQPDVVLVSVDTLRADHLGVYGQSPTLTPEIDRLAGEGVVFERALAAAPWTTPSVASMLTGLPITRHGAGLPLRSGLTFIRSPLQAKFRTVAERFKAAGYRTRAVVTNGFLSAESGMAQGFEQFANPSMGSWFAGMMRDLPLTRLIIDAFPPEKWGDYRARGATDQALAWLAEPRDVPMFLWVHYIDTHVPYKADPERIDPVALVEMIHQTMPPTQADGTVVGEAFGAADLVRAGTLWLGPKDRERLGEYYRRAVRYVDTHVGRLLAKLREPGRKRKVVVAFTADHGEEFWDHGHFEHGHDYYREVTWVPLVLWGPGVVPAGRRVPTLVGLVDVAPTLLDLAGVPAPKPEAPDDGRPLSALARGEVREEQGPPRFSGGNLYGLPAVLMEEGPWRFILRANDVEELFDVSHDPAERQNLAFSRSQISERCRRILKPQLAALMHTPQDAAPAEMSPEQLEAIKALGYAR